MWLRLLVTAAILVPALALQPGRPMLDMFLLSFGAFAAGRLVEWMVLGVRGKDRVLRRAPRWVWFAVAAAGAVVLGLYLVLLHQKDQAVLDLLAERAHEARDERVEPSRGAAHDRGQPFQRPGSWRAVAVAQNRACGIRADGSVWCWGDGNPEAIELQGATAIAVGFSSACALSGQHAWCWGRNTYGALGVAMGDVHPVTVPVQVPIAPALVEIAVGTSSACAVDVDGAVWCWGHDENGQGGVPLAPGVHSLPPTKVPNVAHASSIMAGHATTCAITGGQAFTCWGDLNLGFIPGDNKSPPTDMPVSHLRFAALGQAAACVSMVDLDLHCWGALTARGAPKRLNDLNPIPETADVSAMSIGTHHACALDPHGAVRCWDAERSLDAVNVKDVPPMASISVGDLESCGITRDGALWCWKNAESRAGLRLPGGPNTQSSP